jgi:hypothetical protein
MAQGPEPRTMIREAVAVFGDPASLQAAVSDLQSGGFDRADISFVAREGYLDGHLKKNYPDVRQAADDPDAPRAPVVDETDIRQQRTLETSLAATIAGFAAAGFTVMTGGTLPLAIGLAAAAAGGIGAAGALVGRAAEKSQETFIEEQLRHGGVLLWVHTADLEAERRALDILRRHGGDDAHIHELPAGSR